MDYSLEQEDNFNEYRYSLDNGKINIRINFRNGKFDTIHLSGLPKKNENDRIYWHAMGVISKLINDLEAGKETNNTNKNSKYSKINKS